MRVQVSSVVRISRSNMAWKTGMQLSGNTWEVNQSGRAWVSTPDSPRASLAWKA